jgi:4'-phosphopantetheinyl transferase
MLPLERERLLTKWVEEYSTPAAMTYSLWNPAPGSFVLSKDEAHVWHASLLQSESMIKSFAGLLTPDEQGRAESYHFRRDRNSFIVARGVLRLILARYLNRAPDELRFAYSPHGKPALLESDDALSLRFNVSHSHEMALYAFTRERAVGIDIEFIHEDFASLQVAGHFFSRSEETMLRSLPSDARARAFFNCWTRKEAYIKARGEGLSYPLDKFSVSLLPGEPASLLQVDDDPLECSRWTLYELSPGQGYVAALAVEGYPSSLTCWEWAV